MEQKVYKTIKGGTQPVLSYLAEAWQARNLAISFAVRDLKVQYAQTYLGIFWSLVQPLTGLVIFSFFFQRVIPLQMHVPYAVFAFTGIMGWFYFTSLVGQGGTALMNNQQILKKIHFPGLVLPFSKALVGLVEFGISLVLLLIILMVTGCGISGRIIFLPLVLAANIITGLSLGIWLSALTIRFRDLHHIIPYLVGFGIWITPVFYPSTMVPTAYNWVYYLHPVANVIALYRWIFIGLPVNWA
ncbi:MAG TPA: ABC transporter permease, partial [Chitinophagales bacterium]|nr:ABC transporter permease [Chitinophagales bacterium]